MDPVTLVFSLKYLYNFWDESFGAMIASNACNPAIAVITNSGTASAGPCGSCGAAMQHKIIG